MATSRDRWPSGAQRPVAGGSPYADGRASRRGRFRGLLLPHGGSGGQARCLATVAGLVGVLAEVGELSGLTAPVTPRGSPSPGRKDRHVLAAA